MTYPCPKGCDSDDPDWCSECGAAIRTHALEAGVCPDCGTPQSAPSARFCEVCRHDFNAADPVMATTDSAPNAGGSDTRLTPVASNATGLANLPPDSTTSTPSLPLRRWEAIIDFDPSLDPDSAGGQAAKPQRIFPLDLAENLIGRRSDSLNIHPEVPLEDDPAVSRRHARISFAPDGSPVLLDLNAANGTHLNGRLVEPGVPTPLADGDQLTLGRWTRITLKAR